MHEHNLEVWKHSHVFGQHVKRPGEVRTFIVIGITSVMMVIEIGAGLLYGSMALLADGLPMASHAVALSINAFAYVYARWHAHDEGFSVGTGKVNTLGGYTGAVLLAGFALTMAVERVTRPITPIAIVYDGAMLVAVIGLLVNGASVLILGHHHQPEGAHDLGADVEEHGHRHGHDHEHEHHQHDSAIVSVATETPRPADHYKRLVPEGLGSVHLVVEVNAHGEP